jgi:hypothetical protein
MPESSAVAPAKTTSRVALVGLNSTESEIFRECFKPFRIMTASVNDDPATRLVKEKFEGCVIRLDENAESVLKAARNSKSNRGIVLYGITDSMRTALRFSPYGINAILSEPLERPAALKAVRATYLLALHEFRRYVRVPVAIEVILQLRGRNLSALSQEVSSGGMSLESADLLDGKTDVEASFQLPGASALTIASEICWRREANHTLGIRFSMTDPKRQVVRDWIESYVDAP